MGLPGGSHIVIIYSGVQIILMKEIGAKTGNYSITRYGKNGLKLMLIIGSITLISVSVASAQGVQVTKIDSKDMKQTEQGITIPGKDASMTEEPVSEAEDITLLDFVINNKEVFYSLGVICIALVFKAGLRVTESRAEQKWRAPDIDWLNYE